MSKNLTHLAKRQGLTNNLFERINDTDPKDNAARKALAQEFLIGEANIVGTASFYDFIQGDNANKKAYVCNGSSCLCAGSQEKVSAKLSQHYGADNIGHVTCLGRCHENSAFQVNGVNYSGDDINHFDADKTLTSNESYAVVNLSSEAILTAPIDDPGQYYQLAAHCFAQQSVEQVLQTIIDSNLRGRGGAGFPTGIKWQSCRQAKSDEKYIVCNADEGDPGAFSDRYLLEQRPHAVLFGMLVAGLITGAKTGVLYIRKEYPASISQVEQAIKVFNQLPIAKSFSFKIIAGAGAYICGEETALLRSIEGQRPMVSVRPPFPAQSGLFGQPTVVNNVETFAAIHFILQHGAARYAQIGRGRSTGTKLLSLDSAFVKPGLYEVDMGYPLTDLITQAGGFVKPIKALHIGGPLGGLVPEAKFGQLTLDFESFAENGFLLGHAGIIGLYQDQPLLAYLTHLFEFTAVESCGKCFPCRLGATRGQELLQQAQAGKKIDRVLLDDLLETMQLGSLCALGGGVPLPIKNALHYFQAELADYFSANHNLAIEVTVHD